jgi:acid phosphatase
MRVEGCASQLLSNGSFNISSTGSAFRGNNSQEGRIGVTDAFQFCTLKANIPMRLHSRFFLAALLVALISALLMMETACGGAANTTSNMTQPSNPQTPQDPPSQPAPPPPPPPTTDVPPIGHIALVVLENQEEDKILNNPHMPYLTSLAKQNAYAAQYYADTHPSLGNYFMLTTGQIISNDLNFDGVVDVDNLIRQISAAGKTWKAYLQSIPQTGFLGDGPYPYAKTHNPMAYFSDIRNDPTQAANMVPFTQFVSDLANPDIPNFIYIAPDQVHNMHDCPDGGRDCDNDQKLAFVDSWLQTALAPLLNNSTFQQDGLLIITWDESWDTDSEHGGGHILTILTGSQVKQQFVSNTFYQHESLLRTISDALQVTPVGNAASAPTMGEFFVGN